jgi:hypothetical protein
LSHHNIISRSFGNFAGNSPADGSDLTFQVSEAGFPGIPGYDPADRCRGDFDLV